MAGPTIIERWVDRVRARPDLVATALLLVVSLAIRVRYLPRPLHGDEMITFSNMVLDRGFADIIFGPFDSNSHLLNSLIMKAVYLGVGEVPALMRLPNLIFILLAVVLLYVMSSTIIGRGPAFAAALLLSLHPAIVLFSVSGRGYAGMVLFTLISSHLFLQLVRSFSSRRLFLCALSGFLAGTFHLFSINVLVAQILLAVLIAARPETGGEGGPPSRAAHLGKLILAPAAALALLSVLYLPQILLSQTESFHYPFQRAFPLALINFLGGNAYRTDLDVFSWLIVVAVLGGFFSLAKRGTLRNYLAVLFLAPAALYGLSSIAPVFTLHPRFFAFLLPFTCVLGVAGLKHGIEAVSSGESGRDRHVVLTRGAVGLCFLLVAFTFAGRTRVPLGTSLIQPQRVVRDFLDLHPDALLLTNDTGYVRVRLRQEENMDRIRPALGIRPIREFLAGVTSGEVYFIYVPRKRLSDSALIHHQGVVAPEVLYKRDESLRTYLSRNATLEVDLAPRLQIYALTSRPGPDPR